MKIAELFSRKCLQRQVRRLLLLVAAQPPPMGLQPRLQIL
jgi:hypothetical protein